MLWNLESVFLSESELYAEYELDIRELSFNGGMPFKTPVKVSAKAVNRASIVDLAVAVKFDYTAPCDRCGEKTITTYDYSFKHTVVQALVGENEDDYIEAPDFTVDMDAVVISDILLELPSKYLCKEDCRGVCQKCGKNLNFGDCSCNLQEADPRWEAIRNLLNEE